VTSATLPDWFRAHSEPYPVNIRCFSWRIQWPERETDHQLRSSAEMRTRGASHPVNMTWHFGKETASLLQAYVTPMYMLWKQKAPLVSYLPHECFISDNLGLNIMFIRYDVTLQAVHPNINSEDPGKDEGSRSRCSRIGCCSVDCSY
jgi:hypothetical protein